MRLNNDPPVWWDWPWRHGLRPRDDGKQTASSPWKTCVCVFTCKPGTFHMLLLKLSSQSPEEVSTNGLEESTCHRLHANVGFTTPNWHDIKLPSWVWYKMTSWLGRHDSVLIHGMVSFWVYRIDVESWIMFHEFVGQLAPKFRAMSFCDMQAYTTPPKKLHAPPWSASFFACSD